MSFAGEVPVADWGGPVGIGPAACFAPLVVRRRTRGASRTGCPSFDGRECWRRWRKTTFSGTMSYEYLVTSSGGGPPTTDGFALEEEWSGFLLMDDAGDVDGGSTVQRRVRYRYYTDDEWREWGEWDTTNSATCEAQPFAGVAEPEPGEPERVLREDTLLTRAWSILPGSGSSGSDTWSWTGSGSLTATRSDEDTEAAVAARALVAADSAASGYGAWAFSARPSDAEYQNAVRVWMGLRAADAPGQDWRIYYEVVRQKLGVRAVGGGNVEGTAVQTRTWSSAITLSDEMFAPEDRLGSLAEADASWDAFGWAVGASSATANHTARAWARVVARRSDVLTVRLRKVQTGEADTFATLTTSPSPDGLNATGPVWVSLADHTRTATLSVEWVRDAAGVDVPAGDWVFQRKARTGSWGQRQWDHAATVAGSRFFRRQTLVWDAAATVSDATLAAGACGELLDLEQTAELEKVWTPAGGWPAGWTLVSGEGSQGTQTWSAPDLLTGGLNSSFEVGTGSWGYKRTEAAGAAPVYQADPGWLDAPPTATGGDWTVSATVATYAPTPPGGWGFNAAVRVLRGDPATGEVLERTLHSGVTAATITEGGTDYRVFDLVFQADAEGEMKSLNVLWAEPV